MRYGAIGLLVVTLTVLWAVPGQVAEPSRDGPLVDRVKKAIDKGVAYLRGVEGNHGHLELDVISRLTGQTGGTTSLALLALLHAGVPPSDPLMQRCLKYERELKPEKTYVVGLQTMIYALAGQVEDKDRIQQNVDWLIAAEVRQNDKLQGWGYSKGLSPADFSNSQYALLGLHEGFVAGAKIKADVWQEIVDFYAASQKRGGWTYRRAPDYGNPNPDFHYKGNDLDGNTLTMTIAGLCSMYIATGDLKTARQDRPPDCDGKDCGDFAQDEHIAEAMKWLEDHLPRNAEDMGRMQHAYYALYGIERAGRLSGQRFLGGNDWYRLGCEFLVDAQKADGSWGSGNQPDSVSVVATSFALLFLSKGRTPVLISKLAHGPLESLDWNRHAYDARNLTDFCSRELFKKQPLGWQVFDPRRSGDLDDARTRELTPELLQSPIVYISGRKSPALGLRGMKQLLQNYVENGGFILAEACCGSGDFDRGFRQAMKEIFPDTPLQKLDPSHPVWNASGKFYSSWKDFELWGIEQGCKTVVIYSPRTVSCWWDSNYSADRGRCGEAFKLGANIVAYATGLEPPKPRLTQVDVLRVDDQRKPPRGYFKVAQLRHDGDWTPAPRAMAYLMQEMSRLGVDAASQREEVYPSRKNLVDYRFLYMHGRNDFSYDKEALAALKFNLETGGLLLADACCGSAQFTQAFRRMVEKIWPGKKLERIPLNDELYSEELNGKDQAITKVRCRHEHDGKRDKEPEVYDPELEGIRINGRWAVIFSRYDIGCALQKHQSPDCLGHDHASAMRLAKAAVLYAMKR
jgi:hypothetical protein